MPLSIHYDISAKDVMNNPDFPRRLRLMKRAGVENLWLFGFFYGRHESDPELMYRARLRLAEEGVASGITSVPVGHPGNSLNPDDPQLELAIHPQWRYRVGRDGNREYFCACIDETMIRHNRAAAVEYAQMGFSRHFYDDDLRLGNWGTQVAGCFCDECIKAFNEKMGMNLTCEQLVREIDADEVLQKAWISYNCDKITGFMRKTAIPGMTSGIMVMHNGGPNHGISIPDIRSAVPGCMFRVGEAHFGDQDYGAPGGRESLAQSVRTHLSLIGENPAYSESTVFPENALSPENWIDKIKLEIRLGLRNIFLMSGTYFFSDRYWEALAGALAQLRELAENHP